MIAVVLGLKSGVVPALEDAHEWGYRRIRGRAIPAIAQAASHAEKTRAGRCLT